MTLVSLGLLALYWAICQPRRRRIWALLAIGVVFVSLGLAVSLSPQSARFTPLVAYLQGEAISDNSVLVRDSMLKDGVELWLERPFTGWGVDRYRDVSGWGTYAHDNYIELLVDGGVIGLLLYLMVHLSIVVYLVRSWRRAREAWARAEVVWGLVLIIALGAFDLTIVTYRSKFTWLMLGLVAALAVRKRGTTQSSPSATDQKRARKVAQ